MVPAAGDVIPTDGGVDFSDASVGMRAGLAGGGARNQDSDTGRRRADWYHSAWRNADRRATIEGAARGGRCAASRSGVW